MPQPGLKQQVDWISPAEEKRKKIFCSGKRGKGKLEGKEDCEENKNRPGTKPSRSEEPDD